jgi:hypothetical protein
MWLKEARVIIFIPRGSQHLAQWQQGVANCIMGSNSFVAMSTTYEVDTHKVDGMCAHASKDAYN